MSASSNNNANNDGASDTNDDNLFRQVLTNLTTWMQNTQNPREQRLVDIPTFKGGNQDPIEWIEAFQRACQTNRINETRMMEIVGSYLKGTALTWFNSVAVYYWNNPTQRLISFVPIF